MEERVEAVFARLVAEAGACERCPAMRERAAVLSEKNGSLTPRVLFVAEAPGRQGGDRTRTPMVGDASGRVFNRLLASVGLSRGEVFITNAALCNPRSASGANRAPTVTEVRNCSDFLRRTVDLLAPPLVVTLGAIALSALGRIAPHGLVLSRDVGRYVDWHGRQLIPVYHPSPQVLVSRRSLEEQEADWQAIRRALEEPGLTRPGSSSPPSRS